MRRILMRLLRLATALGMVDLYEAVPGHRQTRPDQSQAALGAGLVGPDTRQTGPHPTAAGTASASAAA